jgi:hypothetical protein
MRKILSTFQVYFLVGIFKIKTVFFIAFIMKEAVFRCARKILRNLLKDGS